MNNRRWWTTGRTSLGLQEKVIAEQSRDLFHDVAQSTPTPPSHSPSPGKLNPALVTSQQTSLPQHGRQWRESIHFLDSSLHSTLRLEHHRATVWETPASYWGEASSSVLSRDSAVGHARPPCSHPPQGHHIYVHFKYRGNPLLHHRAANWCLAN